MELNRDHQLRVRLPARHWIPEAGSDQLSLNSPALFSFVLPSYIPSEHDCSNVLRAAARARDYTASRPLLYRKPQKPTGPGLAARQNWSARRGLPRKSTSSPPNPRGAPAPRRRPRIPPHRRRRHLRHLSAALLPTRDNALALADPHRGRMSTRHRGMSLLSTVCGGSYSETRPPSLPKPITDPTPRRRAAVPLERPPRLPRPRDFVYWPPARPRRRPGAQRDPTPSDTI